MRKEYDFTKARKNPYAAQLKKQITIRLDEDSIGYFKGISEQVGIPFKFDIAHNYTVVYF